MNWRCARYETDISAKKKAKEQRTRLQEKDEHKKRQKSIAQKTKKREKSFIRLNIANIGPQSWPFVLEDLINLKIVKLKKNYEFQEVYKKGVYLANRHLVVYALENNESYSRFGVAVGKKVGKSVVRSRATRLIREAIRQNIQEIKQGYDIVILARAGAKGENFFSIENSFLHLMNKLQLYQGTKRNTLFVPAGTNKKA